MVWRMNSEESGISMLPCDLGKSLDQTFCYMARLGFPVDVLNISSRIYSVQVFSPKTIENGSLDLILAQVWNIRYVRACRSGFVLNIIFIRMKCLNPKK